MKTLKRYYSAIGFLATLLCFTVLANQNWGKIFNAFQSESSNDWVVGKNTHAIENQYDEKLAIRQFAINFSAAIAYTLFDEGRSGVEVGQNDWLFTSEEYDNTPITDAKVVNNLATIQKIKRAIEADKGQLVVAVIPAKARVYESYLHKPLPENAHVRYQQFNTWLEENQVRHIGLLPALNSESQRDAFLRNDTHWSPYGADNSAAHIATQLKQSFPSYHWSEDRFTTELVNTVPEFQGDLLNYIPLEPFFSEFAPSKPSLEKYETSDTQEMSLFDDIEYDAVLVGTSYSAKEEWNFVGALQQYTGLDILDVSQVGNGPFKPMLDYIESDLYQENKSKLVIWEIPERYIVKNTKLAGEA